MTLPLVAVTVLVSLVSPLCAGIISTSGAVTPIAPPTSVAYNAFESNTQIRLFVERSNYRLPANVSVQITQPGTYQAGVTPLTPGVVPAGTLVDSYYVHFDRTGVLGGAINLSGSVTFDLPVLGIIIDSSAGAGNLLFVSDPILGAPGTTYPANNLANLFQLGRGLESLFGVNDFISLSSDLRTVTFDLNNAAASPDQVRIVTLAPEPGSLVFVGLAIVSVGGYYAYRRRRTRIAST